ncbi:tetratricopeptide repeat protein [Paraburkholderia tropica]|uniref:tetratricopeptide repeat protein n=1 Tax=Paraburkholderia tropica TaxID=92647 RepID=UPI002AB749B6|nr:tetratricopeptide repeat protein [Paraburkholderia tropica]
MTTSGIGSAWGRMGYSRRRGAAALVLTLAAVSECATAVVVIEGAPNTSAQRAEGGADDPSLRITGDNWSAIVPSAQPPLKVEDVEEANAAAQSTNTARTYDDGLQRYRQAVLEANTAEASTLYRSAAAVWRTAEKLGDSRAYAALGWLALQGRGMPVNTMEAARYAQRSRRSGDARGNCLIALLARQAGHSAESSSEFYVAAQAGSAFAANELGISAEVAGNPDEAKRWYAVASGRGLSAGALNLARLGGAVSASAWHDRVMQLQAKVQQADPAAMYALGIMYHTGRGVATNFSAALSLYREAANRQNGEARTMLSLIYRSSPESDHLITERMAELARSTALREFNLYSARDESPSHADLLTGDTVP